MKHRNGVISTCYCTLASSASYCIAVFGKSGIAETARPGLDTFRFLPVAQGGPHATAQPEVIENKGVNLVKAVMEAFATAVEGGEPFPVRPDQILHGVATFEAIVKSAKSGAPEKVGRTG